jgi:hypothetical protein
MAPSPELYLISPGISNIPFISNRFGQFRPVIGDSEGGELRLAAILTVLVERGSKVRVIYRPKSPLTDEFLNQLPDSIERRRNETLRENELITGHFYLRGTMDFTYSGVSLNDEGIELTTEDSDVSLALLAARQQWEGLPQ